MHANSTSYVVSCRHSTMHYTGKTNPIQHCQIHSHEENFGRKMDPLWDIAEQLVVETFNKKSVPALLIEYRA